MATPAQIDAIKDALDALGTAMKSEETDEIAVVLAKVIKRLDTEEKFRKGKKVKNEDHSKAN